MATKVKKGASKGKKGASKGKPEVKAKVKAKVKVVVHNPDLEKPKVSLAFDAKVKAKKGLPNTILVVDGKQKEYETGKTCQFRFNDIGLPKGLTNVFPTIYGHYGYKSSTYEFCVKSGYGLTQIGYNRKDYASWKGLLALNDGQFCVWAWPERGLTFEGICELGYASGLVKYRQGKNWVTFNFSKEKESALIAFSKAIINKVNG